MTKRPCHICGSTHWPSSTTTCPICIGEDEAERDDHDGDDVDLNQNSTGQPKRTLNDTYAQQTPRHT
jgi:hypothetical protein